MITATAIIVVVVTSSCSGRGHRRMPDSELAGYLRQAQAILAAHPASDGGGHAGPALPDQPDGPPPPCDVPSSTISRRHRHLASYFPLKKS